MGKPVPETPTKVFNEDNSLSIIIFVIFVVLPIAVFRELLDRNSISAKRCTNLRIGSLGLNTSGGLRGLFGGCRAAFALGRCGWFFCCAGFFRWLEMMFVSTSQAVDMTYTPYLDATRMRLLILRIHKWVCSVMTRIDGKGLPLVKYHM